MLTAPLPEGPSFYSGETRKFPSAEVGSHQFGPEYPLFEGGWLDDIDLQFKQFKKDYHCPITLSAWHWFHINTGGPLASGYGIPGENGTYYYSLEANPEFDVEFGSFTKAGAYADVRLRDGGTPFRQFSIPEKPGLIRLTRGHADPAVLKAGLVWRRFGSDWDGSFWGNAQYFDGFKLATGWGLSWEITPEMQDGWKVDRSFIFSSADYLTVPSLGRSDQRGRFVRAERGVVRSFTDSSAFQQGRNAGPRTLRHGGHD